MNTLFTKKLSPLIWEVQWQSFRKTSPLTQHRLSSLHICDHLEQKSEKVHIDNAEGKQVVVESCSVTLQLKFSLCFHDRVFRCRIPVWGIRFFLTVMIYSVWFFYLMAERTLCVRVSVFLTAEYVLYLGDLKELEWWYIISRLGAPTFWTWKSPNTGSPYSVGLRASGSGPLCQMCY